MNRFIQMLVVATAVVWLPGCATLSGPAPVAEPVAQLDVVSARTPLVSTESELANRLGGKSSGSIVRLPLGNPLGSERVVVENSYTAASGKRCRRLSTTTGDPLPRIVCRGEDKHWYLARQLTASR